MLRDFDDTPASLKLGTLMKKQSVVVALDQS
jgi:hypothetical protein